MPYHIQLFLNKVHICFKKNHSQLPQLFDVKVSRQPLSQTLYWENAQSTVTIPLMSSLAKPTALPKPSNYPSNKLPNNRKRKGECQAPVKRKQEKQNETMRYFQAETLRATRGKPESYCDRSRQGGFTGEILEKLKQNSLHVSCFLYHLLLRYGEYRNRA